ncbi:putative eg45-like domain containing protein 1 [Quercus suber]|uniref:Eg45-like domain containing protein 1 n=1 Tax=Quercus suber TaxID=58331 RepID=A0AAW0LWD4_QUESU|nr:putative eg45-like domain containing protein 1 [Quercus suber]
MFDIYLLAASACYRNTYQGDDVAAVSDALWNNGEACGKIVNVRCIGATNLAPQPCKLNISVAATIIDYCPSRGCGTTNLSKYVFSVIADPKAGRIRTAYEV